MYRLLRYPARMRPRKFKIPMAWSRLNIRWSSQSRNTLDGQYDAN